MENGNIDFFEMVDLLCFDLFLLEPVHPAHSGQQTGLSGQNGSFGQLPQNKSTDRVGHCIPIGIVHVEIDDQRSTVRFINEQLVERFFPENGNQIVNLTIVPVRLQPWLEMIPQIGSNAVLLPVQWRNGAVEAVQNELRLEDACHGNHGRFGGDRCRLLIYCCLRLRRRRLLFDWFHIIFVGCVRCFDCLWLGCFRCLRRRWRLARFGWTHLDQIDSRRNFTFSFTNQNTVLA